jgi:hypothetical protein
LVVLSIERQFIFTFTRLEPRQVPHVNIPEFLRHPKAETQFDDHFIDVFAGWILAP